MFTQLALNQVQEEACAYCHQSGAEDGGEVLGRIYLPLGLYVIRSMLPASRPEFPKGRRPLAVTSYR